MFQIRHFIGQSVKMAPPPPAARETLTADRTYYVSTIGNDDNDGRTVGSPFLTIQKAVDVVSTTLDCKHYNVDIHLADGTYNITSPICLRNVLGTGNITIVGNQSNPTNVVLSSTVGTIYRASGHSDIVGNQTRWSLKNHKITTSGIDSDGIIASYSRIALIGMNFGSVTRYHINLFSSNIGFNSSAFTISGGSQVFLNAADSLINIDGLSCTLSGTPVFSLYFTSLQGNSYLSAWNFTYSGASTGVRYRANLRSVIAGTGGSATFLPGNSNGSAINGSYYT